MTQCFKFCDGLSKLLSERKLTDYCDMVDSSVQALVGLDTATIGTQTDDLHGQSNAAMDSVCQTDDTELRTTENIDGVNTQGRLCEGIVDEKF